LETASSEAVGARLSFLRSDEAICARYELDGSVPEGVAAPDSPDACVELVRRAAAERCALVPWGGGTSIEQGNRLRAARWLVASTERLTAMEEFSPADMVVTAQAGRTLAALQKTLAEQGQWIPLDAPNPDRATLGGIVATNAQGLYRPAFGAPRDRLLGVRVVMADGSRIRGGGKVVKNVAGYDLCKLFAGSWGTLGLITEVTFKTGPLPETRAHRVFSAESVRAAAEAALQVHAARLQPAYLTVVSAFRHLPSARTPEHLSAFLCVGLLGGAETVTWQEAEITRVLTAAGLKPVDGGPTEDELRHFLSGSRAVEEEDRENRPSAPRSASERSVSSRHPGLAARLTVRPSDLPALVENISRLTSRLRGGGLPYRSTRPPVDGGMSSGAVFVAHVPTGIVEVAFGGDRETDPSVYLRQMAGLLPDRGHLVWTRVPAAWKAEVDVWGPARGDFALMRGIKTALDPGGLFSPGRFVGRL